MTTAHEFIDDTDENGQPCRVPAFRYRASQDGYWEIATPAHWTWVKTAAGLEPKCLTPLRKDARGRTVIAKKRIAFKAGEEKLIPASELVHETLCRHDDCGAGGAPADLKRGRLCRDESHHAFKEVVGGAEWLTRVDRPTPLSPMLQAHAEKLALERRPAATPQNPRPAAPSTTADDMYMAMVREARAARAQGGGAK